ncbi:hypothetical protein GY45DRAFT_1376482 [Cubamyces sp. BRFM 1775]|nr:hypothetical protein GY45DRAFT_1376482 [Cubamyces sp. BRFM 1775]
MYERDEPRNRYDTILRSRTLRDTSHRFTRTESRAHASEQEAGIPPSPGLSTAPSLPSLAHGRARARVLLAFRPRLTASACVAMRAARPLDITELDAEPGEERRLLVMWRRYEERADVDADATLRPRR